VTHDKADTKTAAPVAHAHKPADDKAEAKTRTGVKRAKAFDATKPPPKKGDEVDVAKLKEQRREKPDEAPALPDEETRPAIIHPVPHMGGVKHKPGEEREAKDDAEDAGADTATPFPDDQAQTLYGLRKEGRLYRCRQTGHDLMLIEADSPEQAREAYVTEARSRAGEEAPEKGKKAVKAPVAMPALPAGFVAVPIEQAKEPVAAGKVRVVKLAP
jgi:hypothetical protein